jgi:hypothetical protein
VQGGTLPYTLPHHGRIQIWSDKAKAGMIRIVEIIAVTSAESARTELMNQAEKYFQVIN